MSEQPLRILMVLRSPIGGLYRHVVDLTGALGERGHQVGLVMDSLTSDPQTEQRLIALANPPALGVHRTPMPRLFGTGDFTANFVVRRLAKQLNVDVLHGHGAKGGVNARLARLGGGQRVAIYTPHGGVLNYRPGQIMGKVMRWIERRLQSITDAVIFESAYAQSAFEDQIAPIKCLRPVVHNGLGEAEFAPLPTAEITHDFAYVGELRRIKGLNNLLDALVGLHRPDGKVVRVILGGGGSDEDHLKRRAAEIGVIDQLDFVGVRPAREVFAKGFCVVMPSLAESLPYVALEAAAASKPLIATNVGGVKEIFGPSADRLVPAADSHALRTAMQAVLDDPMAAQADADALFSFVKDNFSIAKMADEIIATYVEALSRR